jgi:hypothetical protein
VQSVERREFIKPTTHGSINTWWSEEISGQIIAIREINHLSAYHPWAACHPAETEWIWWAACHPAETEGIWFRKHNAIFQRTWKGWATTRSVGKTKNDDVAKTTKSCSGGLLFRDRRLLSFRYLLDTKWLPTFCTSFLRKYKNMRRSGAGAAWARRGGPCFGPPLDALYGLTLVNICLAGYIRL